MLYNAISDCRADVNRDESTQPTDSPLTSINRKDYRRACEIAGKSGKRNRTLRHLNVPGRAEPGIQGRVSPVGALVADSRVRAGHCRNMTAAQIKGRNVLPVHLLASPKRNPRAGKRLLVRM
jgi:hypothetical protein